MTISTICGLRHVTFKYYNKFSTVKRLRCNHATPPFLPTQPLIIMATILSPKKLYIQFFYPFILPVACAPPAFPAGYAKRNVTFRKFATKGKKNGFR